MILALPTSEMSENNALYVKVFRESQSSLQNISVMLMIMIPKCTCLFLENRITYKLTQNKIFSSSNANCGKANTSKHNLFWGDTEKIHNFYVDFQKYSKKSRNQLFRRL